jgi:SAM-dependent methyltransferase
MRYLAYFPHPLATVAPRDLLLAEQLEPRKTDAALEIGTGSGSSLFRFGHFVKTMHGADVSQGPIDRLRRFLPNFQGRGQELDVFVLDFCDPELPARVRPRYDLIFSCDTVEHVPKPAQFFANVFALLKPDGRAFITFPNERPERAHGITYFPGRRALEAIVMGGGFGCDAFDIQTVAMRPLARRILNAGWRAPRLVGRKAWGVLQGDGNKAPQTFDETAFFSAADRLEPLAPVINAYSWVVLQMMSMAGPVYETTSAGEDIWDTQVLIRARRRPGLPVS